MAKIPTAAELSGNVKLYYFDMPGRAEPVRIALHAAGIAFEDVRLSGAAGTWPQMKSEMPFGQLPVLEVKGQKLAQSIAVLIFVGHVAGLVPADVWAEAKILEAMLFAEEMAAEIIPTFRTQDPEQLKEQRAAVAKKVREHFVPAFDKLLVNNGDSGYLVGGGLTIADLHVWKMLEWFIGGRMDHIPTDLLDGAPRVKALFDRIGADQRVTAWQEFQKSKTASTA